MMPFSTLPSFPQIMRTQSSKLMLFSSSLSLQNSLRLFLSLKSSLLNQPLPLFFFPSQSLLLFSLLSFPSLLSLPLFIFSSLILLSSPSLQFQLPNLLFLSLPSNSVSLLFLLLSPRQLLSFSLQPLLLLFILKLDSLSLQLRSLRLLFLFQLRLIQFLNLALQHK